MKKFKVRVFILGTVLSILWIVPIVLLTCKSPTVKQDTIKEEKIIKSDCEEVIKNQPNSTLNNKPLIPNKQKRKRIISIDKYDYRDNIYVKDYKVNLCFAIHASFGYAEVPCEAVEPYIQNEE